MIAFLRGILSEINQESIIIDVNGIGYEVFIHNRAVSKLPLKGSQIFIHTYFQVLENEFKLYGFTNKAELNLFKLLLTVSGIGAKVAIGILGFTEPDKFYQAIASKDEKSLTKIPGIGKKTAQRLVFELQDKIDKSIVWSEPEGEVPGMMDDILEALETLGYSRSDVLTTIMEIKEKGQLSESVEENIKKVLKIRASQMR